MDFEEYERELRHEPEPVPRPSRAGGRWARRRRWNPRFLGLCAVLTLLTLAVLVTALVKFTRRPPPDPGDILLPDYVAQDLLTVNEWSRPGDPLERVNGIVLHYVGNPGTSAQANRNYFESLSDGAAGTYASSHFIVGLEGEVKIGRAHV